MAAVPTRLPKAQQGAESRSQQKPPGSAALLLSAQRTREQGLQGLKDRLDRGARGCSTTRAPHQSPRERRDTWRAAAPGASSSSWGADRAAGPTRLGLTGLCGPLDQFPEDSQQQVEDGGKDGHAACRRTRRVKPCTLANTLVPA